MKRLSSLAASAAILFGAITGAWAYRDYFTEEQKAQLSRIQTVLVEALVLSEKGPGDPREFADVIARRLSSLGYTVVTDSAKPHDVVFRVKCEQRKTWEGTASSGGDNDLPDAPSRLWKGPACQLTYALGGMKVRWQKEVRTDFEDAGKAAQVAQAGDAAPYAMAALREGLEKYEFPCYWRLNGDSRTGYSRCWILPTHHRPES
ncbi:MAG: hypothetical protein U0231_07315 [Nitrospiraceae bacterium]